MSPHFVKNTTVDNTSSTERKKRVLFVITKSNFGGAQRYVYDLACNLPKDAYTVKVALGGTGERHASTGTLEEKLHEAGIPVIPMQHFMRDMSLTQDVRVFFELLQIVRRENPDVLHVTSSKAGGIGTLIGRITRTKHIIFTSHGLAYDETWRPAWQRTLIRIASWFTFLFATQTIQITKDTYERARSMPGMAHKHVLIHNGRTKPDFLTKENARTALHETNATGEFWIGAFSELTKNKNLHVLIDAIALMHKKGHTPHLFICGEGEDRLSLEERIAEKKMTEFIHLKGYVRNAANYLLAFDIFTLPSTKEGLPYVLMEAGLAQLPVVVSDIPGIRDIVTHKHTGLMVEVTSEAIAAACITLLQNELLRKQYGKNLQQYVAEQFSIEKMVTETVKLY